MRSASLRFVTLLWLLMSCQIQADERSVTDRAAQRSAAPGSIAYSHAVWTMEEGMPQNAVNAILQTRDGYLWLATFGGLARFDGVAFRIFEIANTEGLASNRTLSLYEDSRGALWLGHGSEGLSRYSAGRFNSYNRADGLPVGSVLAMVEDPEGHLWIATDGGLARLRDEIFKVYTETDGLPSRRVRALLVDRQGVLWVGTAKGLVRYADGRFVAFSAADGAPRDEILSLLEDAEGALWVDTESELLRYSLGRFESRLRRSRPKGASRTLAMDREGRLWTLSDSRSQLYRYPAPGDAGRAEVVNLPDGVEAWLISIDREGSLWVGTNGRGLHQLQPRPVQRITARDGLPADEVRAITSDGEGGLWLAFDCRGASPLVRWREGTVTYYPTDQSGEPLTCVSSLLRDRLGDLWLGAGKELVRYTEGTFTRFPLVDEATVPFVHALFEDRDGDLWIGTERGLMLYQEQGFTTFTTRDGLVHNSVHWISQTRDGALWLGTNGGLSRRSSGAFISYTADDGLSPGVVRAVHEDLDGTLWIGTYGGGLSRLRDGELLRYTVEDGLFDNVVSRIFEDRRGNLWMLGNHGLFFVDRQDLNALARGQRDSVFSISFGRAEGMTEGSGGRQPAGWQTDDGKMWFPTIDGMAVIDAKNFRINEVPPPIAIERVLVNGRETPLEAAIDVPPGARDLEFHYTGLSFTAPAKVRFEHLMEGYDEGWVGVGARRVANYTNLPPGAYTFRVRAANNHGVWNESGAAVPLSIQPFFYERRGFWGLCSVSLLLLCYSAYRVRLQRVESRNRRLLIEIDQRRRMQAEREALIEELETQKAELERYASTVSHDLKAPLVTIKGFVGMLERDAASGRTERMSSDIDRIKKAADRMVQLLEDLLELSRIGRQVNPPQGVSLTELAREAAESVGGQIRERGVDVVIEEAMPVVTGDRLRLLEVFQNLIDNAVKFLGNQSEPRIEIGAREIGNETVYYVRDNGIGIDPRYGEKVFGLFERLDADAQGTGIGLAIVKRIVEFHEGRIWVESEGEDRGSTFYFTLGDPPDEV